MEGQDQEERDGRLWMPTKHSKACSRQFAGDAFTVSPSLAQEMGYTVSRRTINLKADAVPSLHLGYTSACKAGPSSPKPAFVKRQRKSKVSACVT